MVGSVSQKNDNVFRFSYSKDGKTYRKSIYAENMSEASNKFEKFVEQLNKTNQ